MSSLPAQPWSLEMTLDSRAGAELGTTDSFKLPEISGQKHRWPLELLPGGTMSWQLLWLGFLLPMVVSARALGPAEKEAAVGDASSFMLSGNQGTDFGQENQRGED
ncbi:Matrix Metalloproteinase-19 [Manis pentadactyla]|nr:Matrix Metalloproteinase-19 [Manis pentadactyla]